MKLSLFETCFTRMGMGVSLGCSATSPNKVYAAVGKWRVLISPIGYKLFSNNLLKALSTLSGFSSIN